MPDTSLIKGLDAFRAWQTAILSGIPSKTWKIGNAFDHVEIGPGRILLIGGIPGSGKTALLLQWAIDALLLDTALRVIIANVEMSPSRLLDRQLARLSNVPLSMIRQNRVSLEEDRQQIGSATTRIKKLVDRLAFVQGPFTLQRIADAADEHNADLVILDYCQRIDMAGKFNGMREKTNAMVSTMRQMADCGVGILAAAALTRSRDSKGRSSYDGKHLSLASFRESSELEYGCDDAFLLFPTDPNVSPDLPDRPVTLAHVKSRDGETKTVELVFHRRVQKFEAVNPWIDAASPSVPPGGRRFKAAWSPGSNGTTEGSAY